MLFLVSFYLYWEKVSMKKVQNKAPSLACEVREEEKKTKKTHLMIRRKKNTNPKEN